MLLIGIYSERSSWRGLRGQPGGGGGREGGSSRLLIEEGEEGGRSRGRRRQGCRPFVTQQRKQGTEIQRVCVSWALACECERVCVVVKCECGVSEQAGGRSKAPGSPISKSAVHCPASTLLIIKRSLSSKKRLTH